MTDEPRWPSSLEGGDDDPSRRLTDDEVIELLGPGAHRDETGRWVKPQPTREPFDPGHDYAHVRPRISPTFVPPNGQGDESSAPGPRATDPSGLGGHTAAGISDGYVVSEIEWRAFWARDLTAHDYTIEPLAPTGRAISIVSKPKDGKTELCIYCAVQLALGRKVLAQPAGDPVDVLYCDWEMTETDLQEFLTTMGIDETVDLSHLHYVILPSVDKLDTAAGGRALLAHVERTGAQVVFFDTISKVCDGDENDAKTWQNYWEHTGQPLHALGITVVALDHSGHNSTRGRGSSAKPAIFDVTWELTRQTDGTSLKATYRRVSWVPEQVAFARKDDPVRYEANNPTLWPRGTEDAAAKLDAAGVPVDGPDSTERKAQTRLHEAGYVGPDGIRATLLRAALKWRRDPANNRDAPRDAPSDQRGTR